MALIRAKYNECGTFFVAVSFEQLLEQHVQREKKEAEEEERADDALTKKAFETVRGRIKRLQDDHSDEDCAEMPRNKVPHLSRPTNTNKCKLQGLVKRKDPKLSSSLSLLGAYSDESD